MILAIDPGKDKCGMAVIDESENVLEQKVCERAEVADLVFFNVGKFGISTIIVGQGTYHKEIEKELARMELKTSIIFVNEKDSTLAARKLYWKDNPPRGLRKIIPTTFRLPPRPIDDYAAIVLAKRYLTSNTHAAA